jgi:hypothetical protein
MTRESPKQNDPVEVNPTTASSLSFVRRDPLTGDNFSARERSIVTEHILPVALRDPPSQREPIEKREASGMTESRKKNDP